MMKSDIRDQAALVAYLTDCTLATVASLKMRKSASKYETGRQISIAQTAIEYGHLLGVSFQGTRAESVIADYEGSCEKWAARFDLTPENAATASCTK